LGGWDGGGLETSEYSSLFGVPEGIPVITPGVAADVRADTTWEGIADGFASRYNADTPVAWGDAIDVPEIVLVAVFDVFQSDVILIPGALRSTMLP
jgi:hypothetical protein